MTKDQIDERIGLLMAAGNFFESDFPREAFRRLVWLAADAETDDWARKTWLQDMAVEWTDHEIYCWRCSLDDP